MAKMNQEDVKEDQLDITTIGSILRYAQMVKNEDTMEVEEVTILKARENSGQFTDHKTKRK